MQIGDGGPKRNNVKLGQKGSIRGHVTYFLKFWDPLHTSGTVEARNIMQIGHWPRANSKLKVHWCKVINVFM